MLYYKDRPKNVVPNKGVFLSPNNAPVIANSFVHDFDFDPILLHDINNPGFSDI